MNNYNSLTRLNAKRERLRQTLTSSLYVFRLRLPLLSLYIVADSSCSTEKEEGVLCQEASP